MTDAFRTVTVRSRPNTATSGKPGPTLVERRNWLLWGHPSPQTEHKVLVVLAVLLAAIALVAALSQPGEPRSQRADPPAQTRTSVVIVAPLA